MATVMSVTQAAERAINRKGKPGVSTRYIRDEIERKNLKATRIGAYYVIEEQDFLDWESKRGRPPQES